MPPSSDDSIDILMVTHDRPVFTQRSLDRLLSTCDESMRVWIWHNGEHGETLELVKSHLGHPRVHRFHHSVENTGHRGLWKPINWLLQGSTGGYLSKVDDDCLVHRDWAAVLRQAHRDVPELGVVGCWRFPPEDFRPELAASKIETFAARHRMLRNCWVEGSGFLMKRECVVSVGLLPGGDGLPDVLRPPRGRRLDQRVVLPLRASGAHGRSSVVVLAAATTASRSDREHQRRGREGGTA